MRLIAAAGAASVIALTAGCGGAEPAKSTGDNPPASSVRSTPDDVDADVRVTEAGQVTGRLYAFVENSENTEVGVKVVFTVKDASGAGKPPPDTGTHDIIPPKTTIAITKDWGAGEGGTVTAEAKPVGTKLSEHPDGTFEASPAKFTKSSVGDVIVTGEITNKYPRSVTKAVVVALCKNAAGKVVAASSTQFSAPAGETKRQEFNITSHKDPIQAASCTLYPRLTSYTTFQ